MKKADIKKYIKEQYNNPYVILFVIISILYIILFGKFVIGDYAYFFLDMGNDTLNINYPLYYFYSDIFKEANFNSYYLNVGMGMDMNSNLFPYLNPLNILIVLLPKQYIQWGVIFLVYIKLMITGIYGYKFFNKHIKHEYSSVVATIVWTFSSYIMLWGQHYGFFTSITMFTVFIYLVYLFVEDTEKSKNGILVLWITLMLFSSYYFLFSNAVISAIYILIYLIFKKSSIKEIIKKIIGLATMGIFGVCIGGIGFSAIAVNFVDSTRTSTIELDSFFSLFIPFDKQMLSSILARIVSNNTLGIANDYSGYINYYEIAMIFTSSLLVISIPQLIIKKKYRRKTLLLVSVSVVSLVLPISGKLFNLTISSFRWTYIICFIEALSIGIAVKEFINNTNKKEIYVSIITGIIFSLLIVWGIMQFEIQGLYEVEYVYLFIFIGFVILYSLSLLLSTKVNKVKINLSFVIIILVIVEMVVCNYSTINSREFATRHELLTDYYNDGTEQAYDALCELDDSLYRVNKTYGSCSENDSLVQGYAGTSVYMTTNPKEVVQLQKMYGGTAYGSNRISFYFRNYLLNLLFGEKYVFSESLDCLSEDRYTYVTAVGDKYIYINNNALPFGYLYDEAWEKSQIEELSMIDRTLATVDGFYYTDGNSATSYEFAELGKTEVHSLMKKTITENDCKVKVTEKGITISEMDGDSFVMFNNINSCFDKESINKIRIEVETEKPVDMAIYYKSEKDEYFSGNKIYIFTLSPEQSTWEYIVPGDINDLRVDISEQVSKVTIKNLDIINCPEDGASLNELKQSKVTNVSFQDDIYRATVKNESDSLQMLCIPLLYSDKWSVSVDGKEEVVQNINSGFCGIEINPGEHSIVMEYQPKYLKVGYTISAVGILVYACWMIVKCRKKKIKDQLET